MEAQSQYADVYFHVHACVSASQKPLKLLPNTEPNFWQEFGWQESIIFLILCKSDT